MAQCKKERNVWLFTSLIIIQENMNIPEDVKGAINEMFLCKNLTEHMACFQHFYEELKDCTFVVFSEDEGTELPEVLHSNYDNDFAIINIGSANRYYAVNSEIYKEMVSDELPTVPILHNHMR